MNEWFYALNDQQIGPVSGEELRRLQKEGIINAATLVWCAQFSEWTQLAAVPFTMLPPAPSGGAPAVTRTPGAPQQFLAPRAYQFEFRGRAAEYFGIWIVNILLTVLTLGIYAAWAKVRTRRYFYGNTLLDGRAFDFTGNPVAILKGNLIFGGLFIATAVTAHFIVVNIILSLLFGLMVPWLIQRALRFRAHHTVYRGVRFNHRGTAGESYSVYFWLPFATIFTLGFLAPYVLFRQKKFTLGNFGWGGAPARALFTPGTFYKTWFKAFCLVLLLAMIIAGLAAGAAPFLRHVMDQSSVKSSVVSASTSEGWSGAASPTGLAAAKKKPVIDDEDADPRTKQLDKAYRAGLIVGQVIAQIAVLSFFFIVQLYFQTRIRNYTLCNTQWGDLGTIESRLRVRDLFRLRLGNTLAILFSLGLLIPWARIRTARYTASRTRFICVGDLEAVAQSAQTGASAIGESAADVFDIDIGF